MSCFCLNFLICFFNTNNTLYFNFCFLSMIFSIKTVKLGQLDLFDLENVKPFI